jgi:hypothetical protein
MDNRPYLLPQSSFLKDKGLAQITKDVILGKYEKKKIKNIQKETN